MITDELKRLVAILADWAAPAQKATVYLFGSRVRGDHRPDSDVDIMVEWDGTTEEDMWWWIQNNEDDFAAVNGKLSPGKVKILHRDSEELRAKILEASETPVYRDRNVIAVYLPPKSARK